MVRPNPATHTSRPATLEHIVSPTCVVAVSGDIRGKIMFGSAEPFSWKDVSERRWKYKKESFLEEERRREAGPCTRKQHIT